MSAPARRLFVVGGTGFVGRAICSTALSRGWEVLSLSRHGAPSRDSAMPSASTANGVQWVRGDALKPESFQEHLVGCTAVVHSVGMLMENGYKQIVNIGSRSGSATRTQQTMSYEKANRDTALSVARAARAVPSIGAFAYISASDVLPFLDSRYISTKREAENDLIEHASSMRPIILRPGFIYSTDRPLTLPIAAGVGIFDALVKKTPLGCLVQKTPFAKAANPALRREVLAQAVLNALEDSQISGVLSIADIERLGSARR
ncbi:hypothetical protein GGI07_003775 [Coemansia sp. Benny D115]|nr:hypothetical protein GGI07_003775 [Coemansia sp. Benny D115]